MPKKGIAMKFDIGDEALFFSDEHLIKGEIIGYSQKTGWSKKHDEGITLIPDEFEYKVFYKTEEGKICIYWVSDNFVFATKEEVNEYINKLYD